MLDKLLSHPLIRRIMFQRVVSIDRYREVRADFLRIYRTVYWYPPIFAGFSSVSDPDLRTRAIKAGEQAANYDPHKSVTQPIFLVKDLYWLVGIILLFIWGITSAVGWAVMDTVSTALDWYSLSLHELVNGVPAIITGAVLFYPFLLTMDTTFVQEFNRELRFGPGPVNAKERRRPELVAYQVWNHGLCSSRKIPVLCFMGVLKYVAPSVYQYAIEGIIRYFPLIMLYRHRFWYLFGKLFTLEWVRTMD